MSENKYWLLVNELAAEDPGGWQPKQLMAEEIVGHVNAAHAAGEPWATEVLMRWDRDGANRDYTSSHKKINGVRFLRRDGRKVRNTTSYSRPARSADSGEIIGQQLQVWWGMSRAELYELRTDMANQADRLGLTVEALDLLIAAMDRHPDCQTVREAWQADGHSVNEIDLAQEAS